MLPSSAPGWPVETPMEEVLGRVRNRAGQLKRRRRVAIATLAAPAVAVALVVGGVIQNAGTGSTLRTVPPVSGADLSGDSAGTGRTAGRGSTSRSAWSPDGGVRQADVTTTTTAPRGMEEAGLLPPSRRAPDGRLAFLRDGVVWVADADGANARQVTGEFRRFTSVDISPDGKHIAATASLATTSLIRLVVLDLDGTVHPLSDYTEGLSVPRWSPDGAALVVQDAADGEAKLWRVDAATGERRLLGPGADADWGATGDIVFRCGDSICLMEGDGSGRRTLPFDADYSQPRLSPDGTQVMMVHTGGGGSLTELVVADLDGGHRRALALQPTSFDWSPDGQWVAFARSCGSSDTLAVVSCPVNVWVASADLSVLRQVTTGDKDSQVSFGRSA